MTADEARAKADKHNEPCAARMVRLFDDKIKEAVQNGHYCVNVYNITEEDLPGAIKAGKLLALMGFEVASFLQRGNYEHLWCYFIAWGTPR